MKLNKVLALALSGVMAVSMLAGCSGNPGNGGQEGEQPPVADNTIASVLNDEQKDNEVKVNFTYSSSLEAALEKTLAVVGGDADADQEVDSYLQHVLGVEDVTVKEFYGHPNNSKGGNKVGEQTAVVVVRNDTGKTVDSVAKQMYQKLSKGGFDGLTEEWLDKTNVNGQIKWSFDYTGEVAAVTGVEDNQNYTYVAVVITCNTTKALAD